MTLKRFHALERRLTAAESTVPRYEDVLDFSHITRSERSELLGFMRRLSTVRRLSGVDDVPVAQVLDTEETPRFQALWSQGRLVRQLVREPRGVTA